MALFFDRVKETATTTGTGNFTLSGAVSKYRTFNNAGVPLNLEVYYCIEHQGADEWEVGSGYMTSSTVIVRDTVYSSTNSNALVNFSAGTKYVFITIPAIEVIDKGSTQAKIDRLYGL